MGVWIETNFVLISISYVKSHPAWVCGLKQVFIVLITNFFSVTPCVGVWIETTPTGVANKVAKSHPAWVCGLKQDFEGKVVHFTRSHPAWVCGLKLQRLKRDLMSLPGHTLRGCVD